MAIQGTLTTMSVPDLLQFLATGRKTGTLKFGRGKVIKQIYFENGLIVGSHSNDPKEYLGQVLIHYGKVDEAQLKIAMGIQRNSGGRLGEILVAKGFLSEPDVLAILRTRTLDIIYDLFLWDEAHFEFYDNEPLPDDLIRIQVEPNNVIMEGIYRVDELTRYRKLIPSDRTILELAPGWTSSLSVSKETRQLLYFVGRRMSVAEICYNVHASSFQVLGQLYELVSNGTARVAGEAPERADGYQEMKDLPAPVSELLQAARSQLRIGEAEKALTIVHQILDREPKNSEAQSLLTSAEQKFVNQVFASQFSRFSVPKIVVAPESMAGEAIGSQEGFVLSRINGEWDIGSILSVCPFREADSLRMIKTLLEKGIIGF
jgi:Domain of unknown function (DUF4388)